MAWTFGTSTSDYVRNGPGLEQIADSVCLLVAGWFYPTTLTAGRAYWSASTAATAATVGSTTSEMMISFDHATTDNIFDTSGAGIVTDKWQFIAWLMAFDNGANDGSCRVWIGDADTPPQEITVIHSTTKIGNITSGAIIWIGNAAAGTSAFQGDIGWVCGMSSQSSPATVPNVTDGIIYNYEVDIIYHKWVYPLWNGTPQSNRASPASMLNRINQWHFDFTCPSASCVFNTQSSAVADCRGDLNTIIGGSAAFSARNPPRILPQDWVLRNDLHVRRR